jgi:hypothetical protein
VKIDTVAQMYWCLGAMDWDYQNLKPSKKKLLDLGMTKEAAELYPPGSERRGPPG